MVLSPKHVGYSNSAFLQLPSRAILKPDNGSNVAVLNNYNAVDVLAVFFKILQVDNIRATDMGKLIS